MKFSKDNGAEPDGVPAGSKPDIELSVQLEDAPGPATALALGAAGIAISRCLPVEGTYSP